MVKMGIAILALATAGVSAAQSAHTQPRHYRLTFVLTYPQGKQPSQTFTLDVPVSTDRMGMAQSSTTSILRGEPDTAVAENLQCTDVHESATGLAAKVAFSMDSTEQPLPGSTEPLHHNLTFNRQVDIELGKPTRITEEMHMVPLRKGDSVPATAPPAPQITVTATEI
jgi:hypothetical protein